MFTSAPRTTEYTTDDSTSLILIPESPSTVKKSGRATSPPVTSELLSSLYKLFRNKVKNASKTFATADTVIDDEIM